MDTLNFFQAINNFVWGPPLLILLIGTGFYLTVRLGLLQIFKLPLALKYRVYPKLRVHSIPNY